MTIDAPNLPVVAYKGFNRDLTCRGFQYAEGETYEQKRAARLCSTGFHACLEPLDVFRYYSPATSAFHRVTLGDDAERNPIEDSKVASRKIKIGIKPNLAGMIKAHLEIVRERVAETDKQTTGSPSASSGYASTAASSGYASNAASARSLSVPPRTDTE